MINNFAWNRSHEGRARIKPVTVAFGEGSTTIAYSNDGIYWNPCGNEVFYTRANHGCWNGSKWVAVGTGGNWVATSYDGINWTGQDYTIFQEGYYVAWNGSVFVAAGSGNNNTLATSTDGISWTAVSTTSSSVFSSYANYVEWTGNVWCATGSGTNTTATCTSADGSSWTATSPGAYMVTDVSSIVADLTASTFSASSGTASNAFDAVSSMNSATSPTEWRTATASYNSDGTASTLYSTNVAGTTTYGEYLTVAASSAVVAKYYVLIFNISGNLYELPSAWYLLGAASASPTSWTVLDTFSFTKTTPPTYGPRGYFAVPVVLSNTTAYQYYRFLFTTSFASAAGTAQNLRVMEADIFYECPTTYTVDRKIRPFVTPNGVMYPIRLGKYNYVVYADKNNQFVETNTFGLSYYSSDISGLDIYANSGFTRGFAYDGQNCVAIADGRMSYTSDFGKTWSDINPTYANTELYAITHNGTFFVMGGNQYVSVLSNSNTISYVSASIVSAFSAATVDSSSVSLTWSGSDYASVQLIWNTTGGTYSSTTDSNATYSSIASATNVNGLQANKKYYFKATPISTYGEYGTAVSDISAATAASLPTFYVSATYDVSALVFFDGSFAYLDVSYGTTRTFRYTANTANTATDISNLTPNTTYTVTSAITNIWSLRSAGKQATFLTNPKITSLTAAAVDTSSISLAATNTAHYTSANLIWNTTGGGTTFYASDASASYTAASSAAIYMSNLTANTTYYYRATPVGSAGATGAPILANATTASSITTYTITVYDTSATIVFDGSATYLDISYVATAITSGGGGTGNTKRYSAFPGTTARDISNLTPDTSYNFTSVTYNRAGVLYSGGTLFVYTLPKVTQITASTTTTSTTTSSVTLTFTGNYTSLNLWWNTTGTTFYNTDASASSITSTTYTVTGLPTNTVYYFRAQPVGRQGAYGYVRDLSLNTAFDFSGLIFVTAMYGAKEGSNPMYLSTFSVTYADASNASLSWTGSYDKVVVLWDTSSGFTSASSTTIYNTNSASISNLSYNTTYYFRAQPFSMGGNTSGNTIVANTTTNAVLTKFAVIMYDTSATVTFDGSMTYIDISYVAAANPGASAAVQTRYSSVPGTTAITDISNLTPDTSYNFQSTIYGRLGTRFAGQSTVAYTLPKMTQFAATETAFTSAKITWSGGKYTSVKFYWNVSGGAFYATDASASATVDGSYVITGLATNTVYYFRAQPVGRQGALGVTLDLSMYIYNVYFSTFSGVAFDSSTVSLAWSGAYDTATLLWDTSSAFTAASSSTFSSSTPAYTKSSTAASTSVNQLSANTWYYFKITPATSATATTLQGTAATTTVATAATITKFSVTMYDTSASIVFDGSMSYIDISYVAATAAASSAATAVQTRYTSIPSRTAATDISNLTPDTSYVFQSAIYNVAAKQFAGISTIAYTLPKITQFSATESSFTSATLAWSGGKYTAMNLWWNVSGGVFYATDASASNITASSYAATGLATNTVYYFRAQPVGVKGALGVTFDISAYIYNVFLTNFTATAYDTSSVTLAWTGTYDKLMIYWDISSSFSTASTSQIDSSVSAGSVTSTTTIWGLSENTTYYFQAIPYTSTNIAGDAFTTYATIASTTATLTKFSITMYDTSASIAFDGSMGYIDISYSAANSGVTGTGEFIYRTFPGITAPTDISNLFPDTSYVFQGTIYNKYGVNFGSQTAVAYTLPKITDVSATETSFTSARIAWSGGNYTTMNVWWNVSGGAFYDTDASASNIAQTFYLASNLTTDTVYYFRVQPVGSQGAVGVPLDISAYIYSVYITDFSASTYDSSSVTLLCSGTFDDLTILYDISSDFASSTTIKFSSLYMNSTTKSITIWGLSENTTYYFKAIPATTRGIEGTAVTVDAATAPTLTKYNLVLYDTSATVTFDGSSTYIDISYSGVGTETDIFTYAMSTGTTAATDISNLTPDTYYRFESSIYNVAGDKFTGQTLNGYTNPKATNISVTETTFTTADVAWSGGKYTAMNLWWNVSGGAFYDTDASASNVTGSSYAVTGLNHNTVYYFHAQPVGVEGAVGVPLDISSYIYDVYLTSFTGVCYDASTVLISWTGLYDRLNVIYDVSTAFTSTTTINYYSSEADGVVTNSAYVWGLSANTTYYFQATPYTTSGAGGTAFSLNETAGPTITKFSITMYDTSASIAFDGSMSYIDISYTDATGNYWLKTYHTIPDVTATTDITNLTPDTAHTFQYTIYNSTGESFVGSLMSKYTLPKVLDISVNETSFTSATVSWSAGNYTAMNLWWNVSGGVFYDTDASAANVTGTSYEVTGLTTDTVYYFRAQPVGAQGAVGVPLDVSSYIYSVFLREFSATTYDSSSVTLTWTGTYDNLTVVWDVSTAFLNPTTITDV